MMLAWGQPLVMTMRAGAWIETWIKGCRRRRSPRGSVDRNIKSIGNVLLLVVAPGAEAWIETPCPPRQAGGPMVAPRAGAWIETLNLRLLYMIHFAINELARL